jgi:hypothetical protein
MFINFRDQVYKNTLRIPFPDSVSGLYEQRLYIRMDLGEVGWGDVDWIGLAQDRNRWRYLLNAVLNRRVPRNAGKLSSGLTSSGLSSSAQLHRVS